MSVLTHELQLFLATKLINEGMHEAPSINFGAIRNYVKFKFRISPSYF